MKNTAKELMNKIQENKWFIFIVLLSSFFGVILGGVTLPYFFSSSIDSNEISNWSSLLASVGTLGTLIFLIRESFRTKKEQKEIRKEQREYQDKQDKLWEEQKKLINFQRYTGHRESFEKFIRKMEKTYKLSFYDSEQLYKNIFPNNGFSQCEFEVETTNPKKPVKPKDLNDIINQLNIIEDKLSEMAKIKKHERVNEICHIVFDIFKLTNMLYFDFKKEEEIGDVNIDFQGKHFLINIFSPAESLNITRRVLSKLMVFSGNDSLPPSRNDIGNRYNRYALLSAMIPTAPVRHRLSVESVTSNRPISFLCEWLLFMENYNHDYDNTNEKYKYYDMERLLFSKKEIENLSSDSLQLKAKVEECLGVLGEIEHDDKKFEHAKRIKDKYNDLF